MKHILSAKQFSRDDLKYLMSQAKKMDEILSKWWSRVFDEHILATLFYEPSTRTRLSFESAMLRLGGRVISETDVTFSSQSKWEILEDTIRIVSGYADVIAIRSKNTGDALLASQYSSVPIINAGDGSGEHPTQALLDLYTISKEFPIIFDNKPIKSLLYETWDMDEPYIRSHCFWEIFPIFHSHSLHRNDSIFQKNTREKKILCQIHSQIIFWIKVMLSIWQGYKKNDFPILNHIMLSKTHSYSMSIQWKKCIQKQFLCIHYHESMR